MNNRRSFLKASAAIIASPILPVGPISESLIQAHPTAIQGLSCWLIGPGGEAVTMPGPVTPRLLTPDSCCFVGANAYIEVAREIAMFSSVGLHKKGRRAIELPFRNPAFMRKGLIAGDSVQIVIPDIMLDAALAGVQPESDLLMESRS